MPHVKESFEWLEKNYEKFLGMKSMVYVGHRHDTKLWWIDRFAKELLGIEKISVLEIFEGNAANARGRLSDRNVSVITGDVRKFDQYYKPGEYDMVFWDEGPEHVSLDEMILTTVMLQRNTNCLLYSVPWGRWPQGVSDKNETEKHQYDALPEHFQTLGMTVEMFNQPGEMAGGAMLAYWIKS